MDKPSSSRPPQKSFPRRKERLIPSAPRPRVATPPQAQPGPANTGVPQPPETFGGGLYANIIRETIGRWNRARLMAGEGGEGPEQTQSSTSSSSLRFSDDRDFDEIADEVIQEIQEEERERISGGTQESEEPVVVNAEEEGLPHEGPLRGIPESPRAEEERKGLNDWKAHMEDTINQLLIENASLNERVRVQGEQTNQLFGVVERMFSGRVEGTQISRQPLPANSSASQNQPSRPNTEAHLAESSRKRKPSTTISQPTSAARRTRKSGSDGGQSKV